MRGLRGLPSSSSGGLEWRGLEQRGVRAAGGSSGGAHSRRAEGRTLSLEAWWRTVVPCCRLVVRRFQVFATGELADVSLAFRARRQADSVGGCRLVLVRRLSDQRWRHIPCDAPRTAPLRLSITDCLPRCSNSQKCLGRRTRACETRRGTTTRPGGRLRPAVAVGRLPRPRRAAAAAREAARADHDRGGGPARATARGGADGAAGLLRGLRLAQRLAALPLPVAHAGQPRHGARAARAAAGGGLRRRRRR